MKQGMGRAATLVTAAVMAAVLVGCEDSDPTVPTDGVITLTVNPSVITIDPNLGETEGTATVIAAAFDADGVPLSDIAVLFSTGAGVLGSGNEAVLTDSSGLATTTLTILPTAPSTFKVRAQSSSVIEEADVDVEVVGANEQPRAAIIDVPKGAQEAGKVVLFDGSASVDTDGEITCFQWDIQSTEPGSSEVVQGPGVSALQKTYDEEQDLTVVLRVTDRGDAGSLCDQDGAPVPIDLFSPKVATLVYKITCVNGSPVSNAGPDLNATLVGSQVSVQLDGSLSSDPETSRDRLRYTWNCGNGNPAFPPGATTFCTYTAPGTYTATLTVEDEGVDPDGDGVFGCVKQAVDTAIVTVVRLSS